MKRSINTSAMLCMFTLGILLLASGGWCEDLGENFALEAVSAIDDIGKEARMTDGEITAIRLSQAFYLSFEWVVISQVSSDFGVDHVTQLLS